MNKDQRKFVYIGNRAYVLQKMIDMHLNVVHVLAMKGSYLERIASSMDVKLTVLDSKKHMLAVLEAENFDILISNGCGYIIPVTKFPKATFINIHPSYLPDLRGKDPIIAAIMFERNTGATCHMMDDDIDNGDIIAQVSIPYSEDLDSPMLYQLSFLAEVEAFEKAYQADFVPSVKQIVPADMIYYSAKTADRILDLNRPTQELLRTIRAFSNLSKGCFFKCGKSIFRVHRADVLENSYLQEYAKSFPEKTVILHYEKCLVFRLNGSIIRFSEINGETGTLQPGMLIEQPEEKEITE